MIRWLLLEEFQNHVRKKVRFSKYVTTIVGRSSSGKSAVLRGLKWLLTNKPAGKNFIGKWRKAKYARVTARIDNQLVSRKRGLQQNIYRLNGRTLKAFGSTPPRTVQDVVNVGPVNFQNQIEPPMWFTLSPPEVSRRLNAIINLKAIDKALQIGAAKVRKAKAEKEVSSQRLQSITAQRRATYWALGFSSQVQQLKQLSIDMAQIDLGSTELRSLSETICRVTKTAKTASKAKRQAANAIRVANQYRLTVQQIDRLGPLVTQLERSRTLAASPAPNTARLAERFAAVLDAKKRIVRLHGIWLAATNLEWEIQEFNKQIADKQQELKRHKGRCRLCGAKLRNRIR